MALTKRNSNSNEESKFSSKKGTITFWIESEELLKDEDTTLISLNDGKGGVSLVIENELLKFYHTSEKYGKTVCSYERSNFEPDDRYYIVLRWNEEDRKIDLSIDADKVVSAEMG